MKKYIIIISLLAIRICCFCQYDFDNSRDMSNYTGYSFSDFSGKGTDGKIYNNDSFKNKITFVCFWFEACPPCIAEINELKQLYEKYKSNKNFQFFGITFDAINSTKKAIEKYSLPYVTINLTDDQCRKLNFNKGYPVNIIVNGSGKIASLSNGLDLYGDKDFFKNKIYPLIDSLLALK